MTKIKAVKIDFVKYCSLQLYRLVIAIAVLFLLDLSPVAAESPTLARLVFWAPPERMSEFAVAYEQQVVPLLQKHHLITSSQQSRTTVDSVFSRLFAWTTVDQFEESWTALQQDTTWNEQMLQLGAVFGSDDKAPLRHTFELYTWPVTVDSTVVAGQGFRQGLWQTYGREDGVGDNRVAAIAADELNQI